MAFEIQLAERQQVKARVALTGGPGCGKTLSALLLAYGMVKEQHPDWPEDRIWAAIGFVDSENGRGAMYVGLEKAGVRIGRTSYGRIRAPFHPAKYAEAWDALAKAGCLVIITDSLSHAWNGEGGVLEIKEQASTKLGNWGAWSKATPVHNAFIEGIVQSPCHMICTMRSKVEYTQEGEGKDAKVKRIGTAPIQRDGTEYEFMLVLDINAQHLAEPSKDNTDMFDGKFFKIAPDHGAALMRWLNTGAQWKPDPPRVGFSAEERMEAMRRTVDDVAAEQERTGAIPTGAADTNARREAVPPAALVKPLTRAEMYTLLTKKGLTSKDLEAYFNGKWFSKFTDADMVQSEAYLESLPDQQAPAAK